MAQNAVGRSPILRVAARWGADRRGAISDAARETAETVPVVAVGTTGVEGIEPLLAATEGGRTAFITAADRRTTRAVVESLEAGELPTRESDAVVDHDPGTTSLPVPDEGPLAVGRRRVLGPCGWVAPTAPADCEFVSPERDAAEVADVGLLGRGRGDAVADEPVADAWDRAREAEGDPIVVVNGHEADHRPRADATLLDGATLTVLDGAAAVADHVGADDVVVYLDEADDGLLERVRAAVAAAGDELPVDPQVATGPDQYRAGAPTAALEAMEGADRIEPRIGPPTPAEYGLHGRPTVIHTPRTVAGVRHALRDPSAFDPDDADPGTRLVTVAGDVAAPATVELPPGGSLAAALDAVDVEGTVKMACVGGVLGGITRDVDVAPNARSLSPAGLGTDGVVEVLAEDRCAVATAGKRARFASEENSGRCVPGREGTKQLAELLRDVYDGDFAAGKIRELARVMRRSANCQVGAHAPRPVVTAIEEFEPEFRAHADGRCPTGTCTRT